MAIPTKMSLNESMDDEAALGWFLYPGYAVLRSLQLAPGQPAPEQETSSDMVLVRRLVLTIGGLAQLIARLLPQATVAQPATVQSICGRNL
jgi:hypothetical protein